MTQQNSLVIEIQNLSKSFGSNKVLNRLSLNLNKGENLVVLGKSGTGKSVLIKCIVRLINSDEGDINVLGTDVVNSSQKEIATLRSKVGFLFQSAALYDSMTVRENLEFSLVRLNRSLKEEEVDEKVFGALKNVGLEESIDKMPSELSGGMRKRVGLARTMILNPEIMLYDEPTTGLDPVTSNEISELILKIQKQEKTSSLIITHDMNCAKLTSNRIIMLKDGCVFKEGVYDELSVSDDPWVQSFFV